MKALFHAFEMIELDGPQAFSVNVLIQVVKNSRYKFAFDPGSGILRLAHRLGVEKFGLCDYGMIPKTIAENGQEIGALVWVSEPTFVGCLIESRVVGMFQLAAGSSRVTRIIAVPIYDQAFAQITQLSELDRDIKRSVEQYFELGDPLDNQDLRFDRWGTRDEAWNYIENAHSTFLRLKRDYVDNFQGGGN